MHTIIRTTRTNNKRKRLHGNRVQNANLRLRNRLQNTKTNTQPNSPQTPKTAKNRRKRRRKRDLFG